MFKNSWHELKNYRNVFADSFGSVAKYVRLLNIGLRKCLRTTRAQIIHW